MADTFKPVLDKLDRIIFLLEKLAGEKISREPVFPVFPEVPVVPMSERSQCSKCGIPMDTVMGYVCNHIDCPTGLGPMVC